MKKVILKWLPVLIITASISSCKHPKNEDSTITDSETTSEISAGDHEGDLEGSEGTTGARSETGSNGQGAGSSPGSTTSGTSGNRVNEDDYSGDGSDGRTESTAVNTSKNVQQGTTGKSKKGYSAPNGTAAENNDGDMYTKHDTTRMPSGSSPIK
jgi:hypothetical protein